MRLSRLIERDVRIRVDAQVSLDVRDEKEGHHERATQRDRAAHRRRVGEVARHLAVEVQILELHRRRDAFGVRRRPDAPAFLAPPPTVGTPSVHVHVLRSAVSK